ncbi:MAG TPA: hypothetical protein VEK07_11925 [Polyangiaceae bacterium]|nr:hypothetical protein [Polyangiaceae bacterium]
MKRIVAGWPRRGLWLAAFALLAARAVAGCDLTPQPLPPVPTESNAAASGPTYSVAEDAAAPPTTGGSVTLDASLAVVATDGAIGASADASSAGGSSSMGDSGPGADAAIDAANPDAASDGATDAANPDAASDNATDATSDAESDVDATW